MRGIVKRALSNKAVRNLTLIILDLFCVVAASAMILGIYPSAEVKLSVEARVYYSAILIACLYISRFVFRIYAQSWRYAGEAVYLRIVVADALGGALFLILNYSLFIYPVAAIHILALVAMELLLTLSGRFFYHALRTRENRQAKNRLMGKDDARKPERIAVVGATDTGVLMVRELMASRATNMVPVCFIDNNPLKIGTYIMDLKVYAEGEHIPEIADKLGIDTFVIAIPEKDPEGIKKLYNLYQATGRKVMIYALPLGQMPSDEDSRTIREINIEDLMPRDEIVFNEEEKRAFYGGKTVLVTGAGGSIGSELSRQLCKLKPQQLVLLDVYENGVHDLRLELQRSCPDVTLAVEIASVRDKEKVEKVLMRYKPDVVFHAAAHKHVPLMEHNPEEAVKNNVFGTYNVVNAAEKAGVSRFVMISTDKAVNPTNIMGASKRLCEMIVQSRKDSQTDFLAVRFGNVLNSNGSVIPLFKSQIAEGGPITVTDKRIIRYFMMIPEAAQLVLQTGCWAKKGDLYVLDMGKPVKILELAENMIRLSGLRPYEDIDIVEIGLRPGEKLYEELLIRDESARTDKNERIFIEHDQGLSREELEEKLDLLRQALTTDDTDWRQLFRQVVPSYKEPDEVNCRADEAAEMHDCTDIKGDKL